MGKKSKDRIILKPWLNPKQKRVFFDGTFVGAITKTDLGWVPDMQMGSMADTFPSDMRAARRLLELKGIKYDD